MASMDDDWGKIRQINLVITAMSTQVHYNELVLTDLSHKAVQYKHAQTHSYTWKCTNGSPSLVG